MHTYEADEPNELDKAFPNGIQTTRDAVNYLSRWRSTKITVLSNGQFWVDWLNVREKWDAQRLVRVALNLYETQQRSAAEARERLRNGAIERQRRERIEGLFILICLIVIAACAVSYIFLMRIHL